MNFIHCRSTLPSISKDANFFNVIVTFSQQIGSQQFTTASECLPTVPFVHPLTVMHDRLKGL